MGYLSNVIPQVGLQAKTLLDVNIGRSMFLSNESHYNFVR